MLTFNMGTLFKWLPCMVDRVCYMGYQSHHDPARNCDRIAGESSRDKFSGEGYCMLEAGEQLAGFAFGQFFAEPSPQIELRQIGRNWHLGKVLFEKWWLSTPGVKKGSLRLLIELGAKALGVPAAL